MLRLREIVLDAREECELARRILSLEDEVRALLVDLPTCREVLESRGPRQGRTRAAAVDRIEAALASASVLARSSRTVARAGALWTEARDLRWRLALSGAPVVYREAHRLRSFATVHHADLVQEGFLGLLDAAKRFEPDPQVRFATYARWWVRAHMTCAIDDSRLLRMSAAACEQLRNLRKQIRAYEAMGTPWSARTLADEVGLDVDRVRTLLGAGVRSFAETTEEGEEAELCLVDESVVPPDEIAGRRQQLEQVRRAVETELPVRQQIIVRKRYGLAGEERSRNEVGRSLRLSGERVRQLEHDAIALLRRACVGETGRRRT